MGTQILESLFNNVSRNKKAPAHVYFGEFNETFKNTSFAEFVFKKLYIAGVHKKVFEWLAANEFLYNRKNYLRSSCISINCLSIFCITCFFY